MTAKPFLALGGLAAVLVAVLFLEYHGAHSEDATLPTASRRPPAVQTGGPQPPSEGLQARVERVLARPLFRASRRPPPADVALGRSGTAALPRLTAVVVSRAGRSVIFAGGADGKPVVVPEGGRVGLYVVQSIGIGEATLLGPEGARTLRPSFGHGEAGGPARPVAASVPNQPSILDLLRNGPLPSVGIPGLPPIGAPAAQPGATQ